MERKFLDYKRAAANEYLCPLCNEGFVQEPRLWEHANKSHRDSLDAAQSPDDGQLRKQFRRQAEEKAYVEPRPQKLPYTILMPLLSLK